MESNKKRKHVRVRAINYYEFETFVRTNLAPDLADIVLITIGIKSYTGLAQCVDFNAEFLSVYEAMNEKDKLNLFLSNTASSANQVKPAIVRELKIFQDECRKRIGNDGKNEFNSENSNSSQCENDPKKFKTNSNTYQSIIFHARPNDIEENSKIKYREKPINEENEATDWSFDNEEALHYDVEFNGLTVSQNLVVKEVTHTYVTAQKINHFFAKNMKIKPQEIPKFIFLLQHSLAWHMENIYAFTMKTRTNGTLHTQFLQNFRNDCPKNDANLTQKTQWLVDYIKQSKYKPSGYGY